MAAPHAAGALAILQDYGVAAYPWGLKALLLATASAPWGVTTGPDNTWGAGRMNLSGAYTSRASLYEGRLTPSGSQAVFVKFGALDFGDRIALTWPRRVDDDGAEEPTTYHAAPDLDLFVYVENDRQAGSSSRSSVDTVEMADFPGWTVASVVKVVRYGDSFPSGYSSIPFAVASKGPPRPRSRRRPRCRSR